MGKVILSTPQYVVVTFFENYQQQELVKNKKELINILNKQNWTQLVIQKQMTEVTEWEEE